MNETTRTRPHRQIERLLDTLTINYETEYTEFAPYALDIYLPEFHLGIEIDGPQHHKRHDADRDRILREQYGVPILRIPSGEVRPSENERLEFVILSFIKRLGRDVHERKQLWRDNSG